MSIKKLTILSIFLAMGLVLHQISPPIFLGVKADFLLSMMFIAIIYGEDYKTTIIISIASGVLSALTTGFPGGQIPNLIDKIITAQFIYALNKITMKCHYSIKGVIIGALGTILSGSIFLLSAYLLVGLPTSFNFLFLTVVLPTALINTVVVFILLKITSNVTYLIRKN